jgi:hypothetical protein
MAEPIMANYVQEDDDWAVTVVGHGKTLTGRAPGIIAARDAVDQLVDSLGADAKGATVVHLLNGSALEFTAAYMTARLARPEQAPLSEESSPQESSVAESSSDAAEVPAQQADEPAAKPKNKASRRPKAKLTADIGDALEASAKEPKVSVAAAKAAVPSARS